MEHQTRFDLNAAVENWRNELVAQPNLASDERRELETHLRDAIAGFQQRGLSDEESFWLARRRVGQPKQLGEEFVKADPAKVWRERVFWMVLALFVASLWQEVYSVVFDVVGRILDNTSLSLSIHRLPQALIRLSLQLLEILPVLWIGVLLARGTYHNSAKKIQTSSQSRRRILASATVLTVAIAAFQALLFMGLPSQSQLPISDWLFLMANDLFGGIAGGIAFPFACIALLVWILPTADAKRSKPSASNG